MNRPSSITSLFWEGLFWANATIIVSYWWQGSGSLFGQGGAGIALAFGRLAGLLAAATVLLQFVFMGRTPWLERTFGLDTLSRIHHRNGRWSLLFLVAHPILITIGYSQFAGISLWSQFTSFLFDYEHVWWAAIGIVLFIGVVITSLVIVRSKWRYESWYFVHLLVYLAVFASLWHQFDLGGDLVANQFFYSYWLLLYIIVLTAHVVFRFFRPLYRFARHQFTVARIVRENHNTVSVYIRGKNLSSFPIYPGQFMILRFLMKGLWWQAHPFSLSLLPNGKELRITVKEVGDFTKQITQLTPGTRIIIDGPYGIFTEWVSVSPKLLFIAGGIGITPIRSLMERMVKQHKEAILLYGNRTQQDIVFHDELKQLSDQYAARVIHILSDEPGYPGETGRLDQAKIIRLVPDLVSRDIYLCGPPPMMDALLATFRHLGVPPAQIHYERFSL